ncbi:bestrophin family protein [Fibrella arboris]|uniref:bestrophin family protein n=1 Tax=Fibrella arboris TaxID=3242486 RepID=UPI0035212BC5
MLLNQKIPLSFFIQKIRYEAGLVFVFANVIFIVRHYFRLDVLAIPLGIPALVGTCISLLLAFRTNQAYERWWEARVIWGAIVNDSRTLIRQLMTFLNDGDLPESTVGVFAQRQIGWCYVLGQTLRGQTTDEAVRTYVPDTQQPTVFTAAHQPLALLQGHADQLRVLYQRGQLTDLQLVQLDATLTRLTDSMGRCERIKNTVFPKTYTFYLQAFIVLFTIMLPFGFVENLFFVEVPLVTLIASTFFLIEKSAIQLQDPFENRPTDTPVTAIASAIEVNLKQMIGQTSTHKQVTQPAYFIL